MSVEIELEDNSEEANNALERAMQKAGMIIGMKAETYAKLLTPVDTGRLRNSINNKYVADEKAVYIGTNVEYAPYQEFGTSTGIQAHHFLKNAAGNHSEEYRQIIEDCMKETE